MALTASIVAVAAAVSIQQQNKAQKESEKQAELQAEQGKAEGIRARRRQLAAGRLARSGIQNIAASTGTAGSSGSLGGQSSVQARTGTEVSFLEQSAGRSEDIFSSQKKQSRYKFNASTAATVSSFASGFITPGAPKTEPTPKG